MCGAKAALYMSRRRLTMAAAASVRSRGESAAISWVATSCAMPENARKESATPWKGVSPAATEATPTTSPKGTVPTRDGAISRLPARNSSRGEGGFKLERRGESKSRV